MASRNDSPPTIEEADGEVVTADEVDWAVETDVLVGGGGGTGLVAGLAAAENEALTVTILEKSGSFGGNTSLSTGMIPAAGTKLQQAAGIEEAPEDMARDILEKNGYAADEERVHHLCRESAPLIHWLVDDWGIDLHLVNDFKYPKHSEFRMHAPPGRNGDNLVSQLVDRAEATENVELLTDAPLRKLVTDDDAVVGAVTGKRHTEAVAARAVVLATDGFAGNRRMVANHCEEIADALYFGSDGNTGDGIRWGAQLGGELSCMDAYQAHATVAHQTGSLSTYAVVMNGGILVNEAGRRFGDETKGYSAFAVDVLEQPEGLGYELFDADIFDRLEGEFDDFDEAAALGAYASADDVATLAEELGCDPAEATAAVERYNQAVEADEPDEVGRTDGRSTLEAPFYGAKITGALFHTQGGLSVDEHARVVRTDGSVVENLYAGGGAAAGISGHGPGGYLSGNGLTTALGYGRLAGEHVAETL
ncbi:FAD-dependent oxidoreductase [Halomarina salina]|uniref:FAD-dependent oxidoreductase n=1 Tax=Halomarina salina TaxID=1872699 RepID=A0ABD5RP68_9EURY|nr:FAD-dependent oxidoreductase [Halomarina salina]